MPEFDEHEIVPLPKWPTIEQVKKFRIVCTCGLRFPWRTDHERHQLEEIRKQRDELAATLRGDGRLFIA